MNSKRLVIQIFLGIYYINHLHQCAVRSRMCSLENAMCSTTSVGPRMLASGFLCSIWGISIVEGHIPTKPYPHSRHNE